jgi:hypothetical protein
MQVRASEFLNVKGYIRKFQSPSCKMNVWFDRHSTSASTPISRSLKLIHLFNMPHNVVFFKETQTTSFSILKFSYETYAWGFIKLNLRCISIYWALQIRFHLDTEPESSLRNVVFWIRDGTMNNVQNCDSYNVGDRDPRNMVALYRNIK